MPPYVASPDVLFMDSKASSASISVSSEPNGTLVMPQWSYENAQDIQLLNPNMVVYNNSDNFNSTEQFLCSKTLQPTTFSPNVLLLTNNISNIPSSSTRSSPIYTDTCYNMQTKSTPFFPKVDVKSRISQGQWGNPSPFLTLYPPILQAKYLPTQEQGSNYCASSSLGKPKHKGFIKSASSKTSVGFSGEEISEAEISPTETKKKKYIIRSLRKRLHQKHKSLHKTELCTHWSLTSNCTFKGKCYFAHGMDELVSRVRQGTFKTRPCVDFAVAGQRCRYGFRCHYCHPGEAVRQVVDEPYKDSDYIRALEKKYGDNEYPFGIYL